MNTDTNKLYDLTKEEGVKQLRKDVTLEEGKKIIQGIETADLKAIPKHLKRAAQMKLNGQGVAHVSFNSCGKLSNFARKHRKKKRQMQSASRRKNR